MAAVAAALPLARRFVIKKARDFGGQAVRPSITIAPGAAERGIDVGEVGVSAPVARLDQA
jgi:hypothetical protein